MLRLLGYFWLFVIFVTTIFEYFWVFWDMQGYFQLCLALLTIMGNFWEFFIHLGKYWDILGTIGYYYGTHGYFCVVFGIGCVALCARQLRTQHQADHAKPTMRRAPGSSSALWRTGFMLQSSRGQGMGQLGHSRRTSRRRFPW